MPGNIGLRVACRRHASLCGAAPDLIHTAAVGVCGLGWCGLLTNAPTRRRACSSAAFERCRKSRRALRNRAFRRRRPLLPVAPRAIRHGDTRRRVGFLWDRIDISFPRGALVRRHVEPKLPSRTTEQRLPRWFYARKVVDARVDRDADATVACFRGVGRLAFTVSAARSTTPAEPTHGRIGLGHVLISTAFSILTLPTLCCRRGLRRRLSGSVNLFCQHRKRQCFSMVTTARCLGASGKSCHHGRERRLCVTAIRTFSCGWLSPIESAMMTATPGCSVNDRLDDRAGFRRRTDLHAGESFRH